VISPSTLAVTQNISLARASRPYGVVIDSTGQVYVSFEGTGVVSRMNSAGTVNASVTLGGSLRHLGLSADGTQLLLTRFITPSLPGEGTAAVGTVRNGAAAGGEMVIVDTSNGSVRTTVLQHSERADSTTQGRGVPNYLGAPVIAPDGVAAWIPGKQDNVKRGRLRDGLDLTFESTVRAITSRVELSQSLDDLAGRIDHDNAGLASAVAFHPGGAFLFVALETSRQVAVLDASRKRELFRVDVGRAPQGLLVSPDGASLYVHNFMDRTVSVLDLSWLLQYGESWVPHLALMGSVQTEKMSAQVLRGKQFFYDARDIRMARDAYISCASCHNEGGHDGRTWDFTGMGEGLRNTISLRGRGGAQGRLHWSGNFDEMQDFEAQIRSLAGGMGLMSDTQIYTGSRHLPLGDAKAGFSADLDALAAYVASLNTFDNSPYRNADGSLTGTGSLGRTVFASKCASCHGGEGYTNSATAGLQNVGTLKASSGGRLGSTLTGIDIPTLRDAWSTGPYLHDGSAATLDAAVAAHTTVSLTATERANVVEFVRQIGREEAAVAATTTPTPTPTPSRGLRGSYFNNRTLTGTAVLTRDEAVNFSWGTASPGTGVTADNFSVRWTGFLVPSVSGTYRLQTVSDEGVRVTILGTQVINNWTAHTSATNTSVSGTLTAGQRYAITVEYFEGTGSATMQLRWQTPGATSFVAIPASALAPQ
jgi:large repetitive protein